MITFGLNKNTKKEGRHPTDVSFFFFVILNRCWEVSDF